MLFLVVFAIDAWMQPREKNRSLIGNIGSVDYVLCICKETELFKGQ